jgi:hypothetical protein
MAERLGRADEGEPPLLLVAQHLDPDPGCIADRRRHLVAIGCLTHSRRRHRANLLSAQLFGQPHLGGDDLADFVGLLAEDRPVVIERLVDPRIGPLLHHLLQLPLNRLGNEHPGRIRPNIYGSAERHGVPSHVPRVVGSQAPGAAASRAGGMG